MHLIRQTVTASACSSMGHVRRNNEDDFYLNGIRMEKEHMNDGGHWTVQTAKGHQLYSVCDGMGGQASGEEASSRAIALLDSLREQLDSGVPEQEAITAYVRRANRAVLDIDQGGRAGTTWTLLHIFEGIATVAHLGDSRVYMLRDGELACVTEDHSEIQRLMNLGFITPEEAEEHPLRHALVRYLGMDEEYDCTPTFSPPIALQSGDRFLLCSDGLTDMLPEEAIGEVLSREPAQASLALVNAALDAGGKDNCTVVVACVDEVLAEEEEKKPVFAAALKPVVPREPVTKEPEPIDQQEDTILTQETQTKTLPWRMLFFVTALITVVMLGMLIWSFSRNMQLDDALQTPDVEAACVLLARGEYAAAEEAFVELLNADANGGAGEQTRFTVLMGLGQARLALNNAQDALNAFTTAANARPEAEEAYVGMARCCIELGDTTQAKLDISRGKAAVDDELETGRLDKLLLQVEALEQ